MKNKINVKHSPFELAYVYRKFKGKKIKALRRLYEEEKGWSIKKTYGY